MGGRGLQVQDGVLFGIYSRTQALIMRGGAQMCEKKIKDLRKCSMSRFFFWSFVCVFFSLSPELNEMEKKLGLKHCSISTDLDQTTRKKANLAIFFFGCSATQNACRSKKKKKRRNEHLHVGNVHLRGRVEFDLACIHWHF